MADGEHVAVVAGLYETVAAIVRRARSERMREFVEGFVEDAEDYPLARIERLAIDLIIDGLADGNVTLDEIRAMLGGQS